MSLPRICERVVKISLVYGSKLLELSSIFMSLERKGHNLLRIFKIYSVSFLLAFIFSDTVNSLSFSKFIKF